MDKARYGGRGPSFSRTIIGYLEALQKICPLGFLTEVLITEA
jgi:hypothetical protein